MPSSVEEADEVGQGPRGAGREAGAGQAQGQGQSAAAFGQGRRPGWLGRCPFRTRDGAEDGQRLGGVGRGSRRTRRTVCSPSRAARPVAGSSASTWAVSVPGVVQEEQDPPVGDRRAEGGGPFLGSIGDRRLRCSERLEEAGQGRAGVGGGGRGAAQVRVQLPVGHVDGEGALANASGAGDRGDGDGEERQGLTGQRGLFPESAAAGPPGPAASSEPEPAGQDGPSCCPGCGAALPAAAGRLAPGRPARHCSASCRARAYRARRKPGGGNGGPAAGA